jgi:cytochrome bd-type quinol oxidase subunit 2
MSRPGARLRALAARVFDRPTMERLIDPVIADLQCEHADAMRRRQLWRARWIRIGGFIALVKVLAIAAPAVDARLGKSIAISFATGAIVAALMIWIPLGQVPERIDTGRLAWLAFYLVPQALQISVPVCLAIAVFLRLRDPGKASVARRQVPWLALACSLVTFANVGWITPEANQKFRETLFGGPVMRGTNELTLGELRGRLDGRIDGSAPEEALPMTFWYQCRLAISTAPATLCLFAIAAAQAGRRRSSVAVVIATLAVYVGCFALFQASQIAELTRWLPAFTIAWIPNVIVALATVQCRAWNWRLP